MIDWPRFAEIVRSHQRFLLVSHVRPDCDALGSELGMAGVLEALGKTVRIVNGQATPPNLAFIDPARRIGVIGQTVQPAELAGIQVLMILDTSAWAQLGPMSGPFQARRSSSIITRAPTILAPSCSRTSRPRRPGGWLSKRPRRWA